MPVKSQKQFKWLAINKPELLKKWQKKYPKKFKDLPEVKESVEIKDYPIVGDTLDGLNIDSYIPNIDSISATLTNYKILKQIRYIPITDFPYHKPEDLFANKDDITKTILLAKEIEKNNKINPLIIVQDSEGVYVLEGAHRLGALSILKKQYVPGLIVQDLDSLNEMIKEEYTSKDVEKGAKVEEEHIDTFEWILKKLNEFYDKNDRVPTRKEYEEFKDEFYKRIAKNHLDEFPQYYDALDKMENELKKLNEALPLSIAKKYMKYSGGQYKNLYPEIFQNGEDRQYFNYSKRMDEKDSPIYPVIVKKIEELGYKVLDYINGYATDSTGKQKFRIGKLLKDLPDLLKAFSEDPVRGSDNFKIVISRHPYDIAGMTSDRAWHNTSCMNLTTGCNRHYVQKDIEEGTIIAYLIGKGDENINHPYSRILIKPYISSDKKIMLNVSDRPYGIKDKDFVNDTKKIINDLYNSKQPQDIKYKRNKNLYDDYEPRVIGKLDSGEVFEITARYENYFNGENNQLIIEFREDNLYGIAVYDEEDEEITEVILPAKYKFIGDFENPDHYYDGIDSTTFVPIKDTNDLYGLVSTDLSNIGNFYVNPKYTRIDQFDGDMYASCYIGELEGLLWKLEEFLPCEYEFITRVNNTDKTYDHSEVDEYYFMTNKNNLYGFALPEYNYIMEPKYNYAPEFDFKYDYIFCDEDVYKIGKEITLLDIKQSDFFESFGHFFFIGESDNFKLYDGSNKKYIDIIFTNYKRITNNNYGEYNTFYVLTTKEDKNQILNYKGLSEEFDSYEEIKREDGIVYLIIKKGDNFGSSDYDGNIDIPPIFDKIKGRYVKKDGLWGLYNYDKLQIPIQYNNIKLKMFGYNYYYIATKDNKIDIYEKVKDIYKLIKSDLEGKIETDDESIYLVKPNEEKEKIV